MRSNDCTQCRSLLDAQWDGEPLSGAEQERLDKHFADCVECTAWKEQMSALLTAAGELKDLTYNREIRLAPLIVRPSRGRGWSWALGLAAATALLVAGLVVGRWHDRGRAGVASGEELVVRLVVPAGSAQQVEVVGDFTGWQRAIPLTASEQGLWVGEVRLKPGRYQYVIVVDGQRMEPDPAAQQVVDDGFGGKNSVLDVGSI